MRRHECVPDLFLFVFWSVCLRVHACVCVYGVCVYGVCVCVYGACVF